MKLFSFLFLSILFLISIHAQPQAALNTTIRQKDFSFCSVDQDCNVAFIFPYRQCTRSQCRMEQNQVRPLPHSASAPTRKSQFQAFETSQAITGTGVSCTSIRQCNPGLVCVGGNPRGSCQVPKGIIGLSHLLVNLIQEDYTPGTETHNSIDIEPVQGGPLLATRVLALVYLSAHDAYAFITGDFSPRLTSSIYRTRSNRYRMRSDLSRMRFRGRNFIRQQAEFAMLSAGLYAAKKLYPASSDRIDSVKTRVTQGAWPQAIFIGEKVAKIWLIKRRCDPKTKDLFDNQFSSQPLRHRPDPNFQEVQNTQSEQANFGRVWGTVRPLALRSVRRQAFLQRFPDTSTSEYRDNIEEVKKYGQCNDLKTTDGEPVTDIGLSWGYDGTPLIGTPPRLYLQVILAVQELNSLPLNQQLRTLTAVSVAMFDAGIAAWYWKFKYDLWRPVLAIREGTISRDENWSPVGIPLSNLERDPRPPQCKGINPDFPAYPSGHASFGTAAFKTLALMLGKSPRKIYVKFTSDEFNGETTEGTTGQVRKTFTQTFSIAEGIQQNKDGRVYIGVHYRFDSDGGEIIGEKVARIVTSQFRY